MQGETCKTILVEFIFILQVKYRTSEVNLKNNGIRENSEIYDYSSVKLNLAQFLSDRSHKVSTI